MDCFCEVEIPSSLLIPFVEALRMNTNGLAILLRNWLQLQKLQAYFSGLASPMDLGTNSPITIDKYVMKATVNTMASSSA